MPESRPTSLFDEPVTPQAPRAAVHAVDPGEECQRIGRLLPASVHLGTSSWSFPGWRGLVWAGEHTEAVLARQGLAAYAAHPVLRAVGIDRSFYAPLASAEFARYAAQVPESFRFVVKAPARVTDALIRGERGAPAAPNPHFLDAQSAAEHFVAPTLEGLGAKAGPLVFQLSPLPAEMSRTPEAAHAFIDRLAEFLDALPRQVGELTPLYAVELRNPELLTRRFVRMLRDCGVRLCLGLHARMPEAARQSAALRAMDGDPDEGDDWRMKGPLVVRWSLHAGLRYEQARSRYAPFDRLIDPDIPTRGTLAHLVHVAIKSGQASYVIANNKAEGSAPLSMIELARAVVR
ncbi:MAG TPA: DUF72 domain-containing protein [Burkholderiaceae bacterium]|nr:DUF72 domain-containing protein [Burkholderiaceae bacterium]